MGTRERTRAVRAGAIAMAFAAVSAGAPAHAASRTAQATAVTLRPLSLVNTEDLIFGQMVRRPTAGTVTINANTGARTSTGGIVFAGGTFQRAEFVGMAQIGILTTVNITPNVTLNRVGGGASMPATLTVQGGTGTRLFPGTGVQTFRVGGTLNVGANQAVGNYVGTFTLTVNYL